MLSALLPSLPSRAVGIKLSHFNSFVVLTKKPSIRRLARRHRSCSSSSCSTVSSCSDDEVEASDLEVEDCCVVYESYAAAAKRSSQTATSIRWSDLHLSPTSDDMLAAWLGAMRVKRHHTRDGKVRELAALDLCFEFLTLEELQSAAQACKAFHDVVTTSEMLLTGLYSRQWRSKMLPETYVTLPFHSQLTLCAARRTDFSYKLSTRSSLNHLVDGTYHVVNNSMLRSFEKGAVDSIRGTTKLRELSCARALNKKISYYEVGLKGCGSVGFVSISDPATRTAYGFGSGEHVGWKGVSYGYHGNDGDFVFNDGTKPYGGEWSAFGPAWGRQSDYDLKNNRSMFTIGCGLDADKHEIFFTLNGELIGMAPTKVLPDDYAAAVSLHSFGDEAVINAGAARFLFDIEAFCASP